MHIGARGSKLQLNSLISQKRTWKLKLFTEVIYYRASTTVGVSWIPVPSCCIYFALFMSYSNFFRILLSHFLGFWCILNLWLFPELDYVLWAIKYISQKLKLKLNIRNWNTLFSDLHFRPSELDTFASRSFSISFSHFSFFLLQTFPLYLCPKGNYWSWKK